LGGAKKWGFAVLVQSAKISQNLSNFMRRKMNVKMRSSTASGTHVSRHVKNLKVELNSLVDCL